MLDYDLYFEIIDVVRITSKGYVATDTNTQY